MSEGQGWLFEPTFNRALKVRPTDERLTADAGFVLLREADHRLGLTASLAAGLSDPRDPERVRYRIAELLRERLYALSAGYRHQDDLDRLAHDPALKAAVWDRPGDRVADERLGSQPTTSRLLNILTASAANLQALRGALADWIGAHQRAAGPDRRVRQGTLDIDSFPIPVHGDQPGGAYNGYYGRTVYHPLVASFAPEGDYDATRLGDGFVHAILRDGAAPSAQGAVRFIDHALAAARPLAAHIDLRMDAAFMIGKVMDPLTDQGVRFVGRLKSLAPLEERARPYLRRPPGRPPAEGYERVVDLGSYQAGPWRHPQRILLVVVDRPDPQTGQLNLLPDSFFLATHWTPPQRTPYALLEHYRRRGTFEDRFGEFNAAVGVRLSSPTFLQNEATLLLSLLAFNLASILRSEMEMASPHGWDLGRLQQSVLKAAGRLARGARRLRLHLAQATAPLWRRLIDRLSRWRSTRQRPGAPGPRPRPWVAPPPHAHLTPVLRC